MIQKNSFPFDPRKATEVAAHFIDLSAGTINIMKLVKLVYLLDRERRMRREQLAVLRQFV
jgi:hypothetical protein